MQCLLHSVVAGSGAVETVASVAGGTGASAALLPAAAAISWVLKDGVGQLGGILFASAARTRFDRSPRRWRMVSALVLDGSVGLEMATALVPHYFLPLAALANTGKNISWLAASAAKAEIHRSFLSGTRQNLADVTAKAGSQTILASLLGTALGIGVSLFASSLIDNNNNSGDSSSSGSSSPASSSSSSGGGSSDVAALLAAFALLSLAHLLATRQALGHVVLKHVTPARAELLASQFGRQIMRQTKRAGTGGGMHQSAAAAATTRSMPSSSSSFPFSSSPSQPGSSVSSLSFHLSPPAVLQRSEPLFFRLRRSSGRPTPASEAVATDAATAAVNQSDLLEPSSCADTDELAQHSSSSSLHTQASFERLWRTVSQQPRINDVVSKDDEGRIHMRADVESPLEARRDQVQLHERWLAQFDALPFIAALQLVDLHDVSLASSQGAEELDEQLDKAVTSSFFSRMKTYGTTLWSRWQHKLQSSRRSYAALATADSSSASSSPPSQHLRILLLHKQGASAEQLLLSSLYTSHLRRGWAAAAMARPRQADSFFTPEATAILLRDLHRDALGLMRLDAAAGAPPLLDIMDRAAVSAAASTEPAASVLAPSSSPAAGVDTSSAASAAHPPLPHTSHFVHALRVAGYHTAAHFVEDDNPVRIQLARPLAHQ
jgi:hypothetical protein